MSWPHPPHGQTITIPDNQQEMVPTNAALFLSRRGWGVEHSPQFGSVFKHPREGSLYFSWSEAVALEYIMFITIGGENG